MGVVTKVFVVFLVFFGVAFPLQADSFMHREQDTEQKVAIKEETDTITLISSESFYGSPHNLPLCDTLQPIPIKSADDGGWMLWFLLAGLVVLAIAWFNFPVQCKRSLYAVIGLRFFFQVDKDGGLFKGTHNYLLFLNFLIVLSLLIYQSLSQADILDFLEHVGHEYLFVAILLIILSFYILKFLFVNFIAWVFNTQRAGSIYLGNIFVFNQFIGLVLMPLVFHNAFHPSAEAIYVMWSLVVGANVYKVIRGSLIAHNASGFSVYYLFLYLCGVELLPLLVVWKAVTVYLAAI